MVDSQGTVICGGHFNFRFNPKLDSTNPTNQINPLIRKVNSYMVEMGIIDAWRELSEITHTIQDHLLGWITFLCLMWIYLRLENVTY